MIVCQELSHTTKSNSHTISIAAAGAIHIANFVPLVGGLKKVYIDMPKSTQQGGDHKSEGINILSLIKISKRSSLRI